MNVASLSPPLDHCGALPGSRLRRPMNHAGFASEPFVDDPTPDSVFGKATRPMNPDAIRYHASLACHPLARWAPAEQPRPGAMRRRPGHETFTHHRMGS